MCEDDIIRKRLIVEGDSGQDDKRLAGLLKTFLKWCVADNLPSENSDIAYQKMLSSLGQVFVVLYTLCHLSLVQYSTVELHPS